MGVWGGWKNAALAKTLHLWRRNAINNRLLFLRNDAGATVASRGDFVRLPKGQSRRSNRHQGVQLEDEDDLPPRHACLCFVGMLVYVVQLQIRKVWSKVE